MTEAEHRDKVSKFASYLLRHNPKNLNMDVEGFVNLNELLTKLRTRYPIEKTLILDIVDKSERRRFEVKGNRIRALYGHTIPVNIALEENREVKLLYHGTTSDAASRILKEGLKPMKRRKVHLSPTIEIAREVGSRRTKNPVVLQVDAETAMRDGLRFFRATDKVYVSGPIPARYIRTVGKSR